MQRMKSTQLRIKTMKQSCAVNSSQRDRFGHQGCLSSQKDIWRTKNGAGREPKDHVRYYNG